MNPQIIKSKIFEGKKILNERFRYHFGLSEDESKKLIDTLVDITSLQTIIDMNDTSAKSVTSSITSSNISKTGDLLDDISDVDWLQNCIKSLFFTLERLHGIISVADRNTCHIYFDEILQKLSDRNTVLELKGIKLYRK